MKPGMSFGITEQEIETVLRRNMASVVVSQDKPIALLAMEIYRELDSHDQDRVTQAAIKAGKDLDDQTDSVLDEIRAMLVERGIIRPGLSSGHAEHR